MFFLTRVLETDPERQDKVRKGFQVYPHQDRENPAITKIIPIGGRPWSSNQPRGMKYCEHLSDFINHEPIEEHDRFFLASLVPLGFEKG